MVKEQIEELNVQARVLYSNGQKDKAKEYFQKALELDPMDLDTNLNLGNMYAADGNFVKAYEQFAEVEKKVSKDGRVYFHMGNMSAKLEQYDRAISEYNAAIRAGLTDGFLFYNLGNVYEERGNVDMALRNFTKAALKAPEEPRFPVKKALLLMSDKRYEEALTVLEQVIERFPDLFEGYHFCVQVYQHLHRFEDAEKLLTKAIDMFPADVSLCLDRARLQTTMGNYKKALEMLEEIEQMDKSDVEARNICFEKGKVYLIMEDSEKAIAYFENCKQYENEHQVDVESRFFLTLLYKIENDYQKMYENVKSIHEVADDTSFSKTTYYLWPLSLRLLGKEEEALAAYRESISVLRLMSLKKTVELDVYLLRAACHRDIKEYEKAHELVDFVTTLYPDLAETHFVKASIYDAENNQEAAEKEREIGKKINPNASLAWDR
ncbi:MAG: tetratricopeptide repeat protein [Lachnospiraceae bacterium]|nr:tetratricopeptide repeat protein [Lachnospiraceae bacterium]MBP3506771.1 tetratricopeptide repeat protein [Lachnospiraceae bacterium]